MAAVARWPSCSPRASPATHRCACPCWPRSASATTAPADPRTRPDRVLGDKAYSSRAIRTHLRERGITAVIPEPDDQKGHRQRRGSRGGRPVSYDPIAYRGRNVVERASSTSNNGAASPPDTTNTPSSTEAPPSSTPSSPGPGICQTRSSCYARSHVASRAPGRQAERPRICCNSSRSSTPIERAVRDFDHSPLAGRPAKRRWTACAARRPGFRRCLRLCLRRYCQKPRYWPTG